MDPKPRLSVIVCTWNRAESLAAALASIDACELPPSIDWEVLIVDNNSTDDTKAVFEKFCQLHPARYRYLFEKRQGKSFALNAAIENARGDIFVFTDDDVTVDKNWLAETLKIFDTFPCIGVGGKIVDSWISRKPDWLSLEGPYSLMTVIVTFNHGDQPCELNAAPYGANLALRREVFQKYGGFRTDLGPTSGSEIRGEDVEFCRRLLRAGEKLFYAPKAIVFHPVPENRTTKRYFQDWYYAYGQSMARMEQVPDTTVRYFGFPRYRLQACLLYLFQWLISLSGKRRFFYKLQVFSTWGRMREERRLWQSAKAGDNGETPVGVR